ncbi:PP221 [Orf virus]|uniref:PP221 n=1 Tax=Orf virus TaxID=10258 RepID=F1AX91_ORFV|nr:PP221 [Orf virus]
MSARTRSGSAYISSGSSSILGSSRSATRCRMEPAKESRHSREQNSPTAPPSSVSTASAAAPTR